MLVSSECAWGPSGAVAVEVDVDGRRVELALPHGNVAVRALRGAAIRPPDGEPSVTGQLRHPAFTSDAPALLARGVDAQQIVHVGIPLSAGTPPRPQRHRFSGPVLTAAVIGRRVVALVARGDEVHVEVHGKGLGAFADLAIDAATLGLDADAVARLADGPLAPLVYDSGDLVVELDKQWWVLSTTHPPRTDDNVLSVLARQVIDQPHIARRWGEGQIFVTYRAAGGALPARTEEVVLGPGGLVGWPEDDRRWHIAPLGRTVTIGEGERVLALQEIDDAPALLTISAAGLILRLRWPAGEHTLTAWSGGAEPPVVHPSRPWVVTRDDRGRLTVADFVTNTTLRVLSEDG